jgi:hypothetical protein
MIMEFFFLLFLVQGVLLGIWASMGDKPTPWRFVGVVAAIVAIICLQKMPGFDLLHEVGRMALPLLFVVIATSLSLFIGRGGFGGFEGIQGIRGIRGFEGFEGDSEGDSRDSRGIRGTRTDYGCLSNLGWRPGLCWKSTVPNPSQNIKIGSCPWNAPGMPPGMPLECPGMPMPRSHGLPGLCRC